MNSTVLMYVAIGMVAGLVVEHFTGIGGKILSAGGL